MDNSRNVDNHDAPLRLAGSAPFTAAALEAVLTITFKIERATPIAVAYSGGRDSHVLLHAVTRTAYPVRALHINHGLQSASRAWAAHCAATCHALGIEGVVECVTVTDRAERGLEAAARDARYTALARLLRPGEVLLTAHHQDDQAETLLLQLLRGAGVHGLAGMRSIAPFGVGRLARPLLGFTRQTLADYAAAAGLQWIEDTSNDDLRLRRNYLRAEIVPRLEHHWPRASVRLADSARHAREAVAMLDEIAGADITLCRRDDGLSLAAVAQLSPPRRANLIRYWLRRSGLQAPPETALRQMLDQVDTCPRTRHAVIGWSGAEVRRYRDQLTVGRLCTPPPPGWDQTWDLTTPLAIPGTGQHLRATPVVGAGIATARISGTRLHVRMRRGGEICRVRGHRRPLKKLLQAAGMPPWERALLPLIYANDELAAVGHHWVCEPYAAQPGEPGWLVAIEN